jgi:hypothetical protein
MPGKILRAIHITPALLIAAAGLLIQAPIGGQKAYAQSPAAASTSTPRAAQNRVVGEVTAINPATKQLSIKTGAGETVTIQTDERTSFRRIPPGETQPDKATKVEFTNISVGERVVVYNNASQGGTPASAKTVYVTSETASAAGDRNREDWARRGLNGRITALNAEKKEITVMARSREGAGPVTIVASGNVRFLRYAPDSMSMNDARPGSFADLRIGDQVRARGERSADGKSFTPEEIVSGAITRTGGTITAINAAGNQLTIKNSQTGQTVTVRIGPKSALRRLTPEVAASLAERRERGRGGEGGGASQGAQSTQPRTQPGGGGDGARGNGGPRPGGRGQQGMFENLPTITLAELKQGDAVFVMGSANDNPSNITAITLVTGDAEILQRLQGRPNRDGRGANQGLPGDVIGGGENNRGQP